MQPTYRPHLVPLARFLADVTVRSSGGDAVQHPMDAILAFVRAHPNTDESIAVMKATMAIIDCWGAIHESDILTLSDRSLLFTVSIKSYSGNALPSVEHVKTELAL